MQIWDIEYRIHFTSNPSCLVALTLVALTMNRQSRPGSFRAYGLHSILYLAINSIISLRLAYFNPRGNARPLREAFG